MKKQNHFDVCVLQNTSWYDIKGYTVPGFSTGGDIVQEVEEVSSYSDRESFAITSEFGFKIDVGNDGGFFIQTGIAATFAFGKEKYEISYSRDNSLSSFYKDRIDAYIQSEGGNRSSERDYFSIYPRLYFGIGVAF